MANIVSLDMLEDELHAVAQAGGYESKEEVVGHALEVLLSANPHLRISTAVELYRRSSVTLSRATEIAGLDLEAFKEKLYEKQVPIHVVESSEEIKAGAESISRMRQDS
jgi:predicted HTH domain antitoxin